MIVLLDFHLTNKLLLIQNMKIMKTIAISIFSLLMIFAIAVPGYSLSPLENSSSRLVYPAITYQVNIHMSDLNASCGTYIIEVEDANGAAVAPSQVFIPGKLAYFFSEVGPVNSKRTATFENTHTGVTCNSPLTAAPSSRTGLFMPGVTYNFELAPHYPTTLPGN